MSAMRIGVDIGGTKVDAVVLDPAGKLIARHVVPVTRGPDGVIASSVDAVEGVCANAGIEPGDAERVGVGVPGSVTDGVVRHALNLGVTELDLGAALREAWAVPVAIDNDVNAAAVGAWKLIGQPGDSVAYLNLGTGLAAGLILDRRLWRGGRGIAGEIGHISIDPAGPVDADGLPGRIETYASGSGIAWQWGRPGESAADVMAAADAGDTQAQRIREQLFTAVGTAVRILALTLDVDHVILGGGLTRMGETLLDGVRERLTEWEGASPFLASLDIGGRVTMVEPGTAVAAIGAAIGEVDHG